MRNRKRHSKFSMRTSQRKATLRNMVRSLIKYQKIETIHRRAKEARRLAEHLITAAKEGTIASRRMAYSILGDRDLVMKLFKETVPLFKNRNSGYTRIIQLGFRRGDGAEMAILELTEKNVVEKLAKKKKEKKPEAKKPETAEAGEEPKKEKKEEPKAKTIPKSKPTLAEEKRSEKAKVEDKKAADKRGFMKNLRGMFRKRGDR